MGVTVHDGQATKHRRTEHRRCDLTDSATNSRHGLLGEDDVAIFIATLLADLANRIRNEKVSPGATTVLSR